jgi:hypothetical protein
MGLRTFIEGWPVYRQLAGADSLGRGAAARSGRSARLGPRTGSADAVVKSVCPYCAVGCGQDVCVRAGTSLRDHHPCHRRDVSPDLGLGQGQSDQVQAVRPERPRGGPGIPGPADPRPSGLAHHRLQGGDQAARAGLPFRPAIRASTRSTGSRLATTTKSCCDFRSGHE